MGHDGIGGQQPAPRKKLCVRATVEKIRAIAGGSADKPGLPRPTMVRAAG